jgi:hypothetical protein
LQQAPVGLGQAAQELTDFEVVGGHGTDQWHQVLADVFGDGFRMDLEGQVIAALGWIFVEGALQEMQGLLDLALELILPQPERLTLFIHMYAYNYAYIGAKKPLVKRQNVEFSSKHKKMS